MGVDIELDRSDEHAVTASLAVDRHAAGDWNRGRRQRLQAVRLSRFDVVPVALVVTVDGQARITSRGRGLEPRSTPATASGASFEIRCRARRPGRRP